MADDQAALVLTFGADIRALEANMNRALASVERNMKAMEARASGAEKRIAQVFGQGNIGKAIENSFSSIRGDLLSSATGQVGALGAGLKVLGPAGLAAAGGIVALGAALSQAKSFMDWAAQIERTSKELGLTTTQVQEFSHVATALNIPVESLTQSLGALEARIGLIEEHAARKMQLAQFVDVLKITPDQLRGWGTLEQQLPHILDAFARLGPEARAAAASRMGMSPEVINALVEGRNKIEDLIAEAHKMGLVLDEDAIQKGAQASVEFKKAAEVIDINLKTAFADLIPVVGEVANAIANAARSLNEFLESFKKLQDRNEGALQTELADAEAEKAFRKSNPAGGFVDSAVESDQHLDDRIATITALIMAHQGADAITAANEAKGNVPIVPGTAHAHKTKSDQDRLTEEADAALLEAKKAEAEAQAKLTDDAEKRADFEDAATQQELALQIVKIEKLRQEILKSDSIDAAHATILDASLAEAETRLKAAAAAKTQLTDRNAQIAEEQTSLQVYKTGVDAQVALLEAQKSITRSVEQRRDLELKILALKQQQARDEEQARIGAEVQSGRLTPAQGAHELANFDTVQSAERFQAQNQNLGPIGDRVAQLQGLDFKQLDVNGADAFATALENIATRSESAGKAFHQMASSILADIIRMTVQKEIELPILQALGVATKSPLPSTVGPAGLASFTPAAHGIQIGDQAASSGLTQVAAAATAAAAALRVLAASGGAGGIGNPLSALGLNVGGFGQAGALAGGWGNPLSALGIGADLGAASGDSSFAALGLASLGNTAAAAPGLGSLFSTLFKFLPFFGFADGTEFAPGGFALVGEKGPELLNVPRGSQIFPNSITRSLGAPAGKASTGLTVIAPLHFHAEGAVMTEELLAQANAQSERHARAYSQAAMVQSRAALPLANRSDRLLRG